ncbi:MAG TPA: hypothetical protein VHS06_11130, partial [Chloroflexota bacterium]|nr:hypothetical protein [Chloroflexota bacterium]
LGTIVHMRNHRGIAGRLITTRSHNDPVSEAYRILRTNVEFASAGESPLMLIITGPAGHEGKSLTSANLAISFAQSGKRTLLVDADLRRPTLHTLFGDGDLGFLNVRLNGIQLLLHKLASLLHLSYVFGCRALCDQLAS